MIEKAPQTPNPAAGRTPRTNRLGLTKDAYKGRPSTMCNGCGHDAITNAIISAAYELGLDQYDVVKLSGIGCSSKTPAYFLGQSHGINAVHGRMPSIATGAFLANKHLHYIGVSGDGDTASIGIGQFCHLVRRNIPVVYIVENNGVYGLTKGQFSATADEGSTQKGGSVNEFMPIDLCALALELGCGFVARSFSGDQKQLMPLLQAAFSHRGTAILDVISPCVTFNNHEGSTRSYTAVKKNDEPIHEIGFVPYFEQIEVDYAEGSVTDVEMPDGSHLTLKKLERDYDPSDRSRAIQVIHESMRDGKLLTGIFYIDPKKPSFDVLEGVGDTALCQLRGDRIRPKKDVLDAIMAELL